MSQPPGHYPAEGDPPNTVRYWDGEQWVGDPIPAPPSATPPPPPGAATAPNQPFATLGVRLGAAVLDGIIVFAVWLVIAFALSAGTSGGILIGVLIYVVYLWLVVEFGATPGKLALGLRITEEDGTTPVGWRGAFMRSIPDLLGNLPLIGWLIMLGAGIGSIFLINSDAENRSVYDRVGNTRVVRKQAL